MRKMHQTQKDYAMAKALMSTLREMRDDYKASWVSEHGEINDTNFDKWNEDVTNWEAQNGYWEALDMQAQAEWAMVKWANEKVIHLATAKQASEIRRMTEKFNTYEMMPKHREKMIDLAFHLSPR